MRLTNCGDPRRKNMKIVKVRVALHEAVMQVLGFATTAVRTN